MTKTTKNVPAKTPAKKADDKVTIRMPNKREINAANSAYDKAITGSIKMMEAYNDLGTKLTVLKDKVNGAKPTASINVKGKAKNVRITFRDWCDGNAEKGVEANLHFSWKMAEKCIQLARDWGLLEESEGGVPTSLNEALSKSAKLTGGKGSRKTTKKGKVKATPEQVVLQQIENLSNALSVLPEVTPEIHNKMQELGKQYEALVKAVKQAA